MFYVLVMLKIVNRTDFTIALHKLYVSLKIVLSFALSTPDFLRYYNIQLNLSVHPLGIFGAVKLNFPK